MLVGPFETVTIPDDEFWNPQWFKDNFIIEASTGRISGRIPEGTRPGTYYVVACVHDSVGSRAMGIGTITVLGDEKDNTETVVKGFASH